MSIKYGIEYGVSCGLYENEKKQFNMFDMMIFGQRESQDPG